MELTKTITDSNLWRCTLGLDEAKSENEINRLKSSFLVFRERAASLSNQINSDLPSLTVHDITHLDALWEMASLIIGEDYSLSPVEGYVLGGAILLHDLAMSIAATPGGYDAIQKDVRYKDLIFTGYQEKFGRSPSEDEILNPETSIKETSLFSYLRTVHAENAERLVNQSYELDENDKIYLIDDVELRQTFGSLIGAIAHSHWWSTERIEKEFSRIIGAPSWAPSTWTIDPLKLACILRTADAIHLDSRRAPTFKKAFSNLSDTSREHWTFQEALNKPYVDDDAVIFTSNRGFELSDAVSWWLCLDALKLADRELRSVDALLSDKSLPRFRARRIAGIDLPERFVEYVRTVDWFPINATVHISDLPNVVRSLGGEQLYGSDSIVPLREMIQNAADAVRARRIYEKREDGFGEVTVSLIEENESFYLKISDNGIGMSQNVLTNFLLDFGTSFWSSASVQEEMPGLLSSGFRPTGQYGIGFFSVFMVSDSVKVVTRRSDAAQKDTVVLEFNNGVYGRPILRPATNDEASLDGGTTITIKLNSDPKSKGGILFNNDKDCKSLEDTCKKLAPTIDVDLYVGSGDARKKIVSANDWQSIDGAEFLSRFDCPNHDNKFTIEQIENLRKKASSNLRPLIDDGKVVGRALVMRPGYFSEDPAIKGCVSIGGLVGSDLSGIAGVLLGTSLRASRDEADPIVTESALKKWAEEQVELIPALYPNEKEQVACSEIITQCGAHTGNLKIVQWKDKWISALDIEAMKLPEEIIVAYGHGLDQQLKNVEDYMLFDNVFKSDALGITSIIPSRRFRQWPNRKLEEKEYYLLNSTGAAIRSIATSWGVCISTLLQFNDLSREENIVVGSYGGGDIVTYALRLQKPKK